MVVMLAPLLCIFKAFISPAQSLLQCSERQSLCYRRDGLAGVVDMGVAWYLIPAHGAVGACIGNGAAQATAVLDDVGRGNPSLQGEASLAVRLQRSLSSAFWRR